MNIDDTINILRKNTWKLRGYTYKITHISAAYNLYVANMVPTYCYDTALYLNGNICQLSHSYILEN